MGTAVRPEQAPDAIDQAWAQARPPVDPIDAAWNAARPQGQQAQRPPLLKRVGQALYESVKSPAALANTAKGIVTAPLQAGKTYAQWLGQTAAETTLSDEDRARALADPERISEKQGAFAGVATAASLIPFTKVLPGAAAALGGSTAARIGVNTAYASGTGAAFNPNDPAVGAVIGGAVPVAGELAGKAITKLRTPGKVAPEASPAAEPVAPEPVWNTTDRIKLEQSRPDVPQGELTLDKNLLPDKSVAEAPKAAEVAPSEVKPTPEPPNVVSAPASAPDAVDAAWTAARPQQTRADLPQPRDAASRDVTTVRTPAGKLRADLSNVPHEELASEYAKVINAAPPELPATLTQDAVDKFAGTEDATTRVKTPNGWITKGELMQERLNDVSGGSDEGALSKSATKQIATRNDEIARMDAEFKRRGIDPTEALALEAHQRELGKNVVPSVDELPTPPTTETGAPPPEVANRGEAWEPTPPAPARGEVAPIEGTGETKTRGLSAGVEAKAVENKLTQSFGDLPKYKTAKMADQAARATQLLTDDSASARRIALGEEAPPTGLHPESVLVAVENRAIAEGDVGTLRELASGKLTEQATTMGQRIRTLAERDPESPVGAIEEVIKARTRGAKDAAGSLKAELADLQSHITNEKAYSNFETLTKLINLLRC